MDPAESFMSMSITHWTRLKRALKRTDPLPLSGKELSIADVIAVSRHGRTAVLNARSIPAMNESATMTEQMLSEGDVIYGVNTGFGGSADTRTRKMHHLQDHLITGLRYGFVAEEKPSRRHDQQEDFNGNLVQPVIEFPISMPDVWVRASMLIRANTLASGASGIRVTTVNTMLLLLNKGLIPIIPLRGSISASGDLSPLSYVGAVLQARSNAWIREEKSKDRKVTSANIALQDNGITPIRLGPKEGLALVNGTAVSAAVAALAMHEAVLLANLAQLVTAMSVEALAGTKESFHPFISNVRPHPGQKSVTKFINHCLQGSQLLSDSHTNKNTLRQDRYSIRTAPQWMGPIVEDIQLAFSQISIELNSVTDNPLLDIQNSKMLHGGNFQAKSVTSAMEKVRQGCESIGRMLFAQTTELINPATNRGLPPNLVIDEPSTSQIWKGTDILVAALQSELGFLANTVASHVQTAEMGNQAINSLALISCRYTLEALSVLAQIISATIVALCQALDIRAMNKRFLAKLEPIFKSEMKTMFSSYLSDGDRNTELVQDEAWGAFYECYSKTTTLDSPERFEKSAEASLPILLKVLIERKGEGSLALLHGWTRTCASLSQKTYVEIREHHFMAPDTQRYLGSGSSKLYDFVRNRCAVPFLRNANLAEYQASDFPRSHVINTDKERKHKESDSLRTPTMGGLIANVFERIVDGTVCDVVMDCVCEADRASDFCQPTSKL